MMDQKRFLILCTGNSARSQMAEGILRNLASESTVESAGVAPSHVRPEAIAALAEIGIDISNHRSKSVDEFAGEEFDFVITVCDKAEERCPAYPSTTLRIHWPLADPAAVAGDYETRLASFRQIRDEIMTRVRRLLENSS